jgi:ABC-type uncharacterized transport system ATPase subunit
MHFTSKSVPLDVEINVRFFHEMEVKKIVKRKQENHISYFSELRYESRRNQLITFRVYSLLKICGIVQENTLKCLKLFHFRQQKIEFNQNVWHDHATMQQNVLLHFWVIFLY